MIVMNHDGDLFEERRKRERRKNNNSVSRDKRTEDRRKIDINKKAMKDSKSEE